MDTLTVGALANASGVTVRTLHHYDNIGLLPASGRTNAGYRTYDESAVDRLRTILTYRELGLGLDEIAEVLADDGDGVAALRSARRRTKQRITRLRAIERALDAAITADERGTTMTPGEKLSVYGDFDPADHEDEAGEPPAIEIPNIESRMEDGVGYVRLLGFNTKSADDLAFGVQRNETSTFDGVPGGAAPEPSDLLASAVSSVETDPLLIGSVPQLFVGDEMTLRARAVPRRRFQV